MSHILDALQKVQEEKAAKLKPTTITGGVLLDAPTAKKTRSNRFLLAGSIVALLLIAALVVQWYQKPAPRSQAGLPSEPLPLQQAQQPQAAAAPVPPPLAVADVRQPAAAPVVPLAPAPASTPSAAAPAAPATPSPQAVQEEDPDEQSVSRRRQQKTAVAAPTAEQGRVVQTSTPEGIKLTGIAWQENRKLRRAVVNEMLAGEGTVIAGAQIVEIRPQAVRFEKNGMLYEVGLAR